MARRGDSGVAFPPAGDEARPACRTRRWLLFLALVAGLAGTYVVTRRAGAAAVAPGAAGTTIDEWFGAYLGGQKIGFMSVVCRPVERDGKQLLEYIAADHVVINVMGQKLEQTTASVTLCDAAYRPLETQVTIKSAGMEMAVSGTFFADRVECRKTSKTGTVPVTVPIPKEANLVVDERALLSDGKLAVGQTLVMYQFNPLSLAIEKHELTGVRTERITIGGKEVETTVIKLVSPMAQPEVWVDAQGQMLKLELPLMAAKLQFLREDEQTATTLPDDSSPRVDLVVATAIRPATPIDDPRNVSRLSLEVGGLGVLKNPPQGDWQTIRPLDGGRSQVTIEAVAPPPSRSGEKLSEEDRKLYLAATTYIESDHPDLRAAVKTILGDHPPESALERATLLHDWVNHHIKWQANIGLFRSALEILHDPAGVCRDAAALYTALARAAGVPTRICAGLVYVSGTFMGHAWAESWTGHWQPVDATLPVMFVDATHLKLAQGAEYTCLFNMLPALGALTIEVQAVEHRQPGPAR